MQRTDMVGARNFIAEIRLDRPIVEVAPPVDNDIQTFAERVDELLRRVGFAAVDDDAFETGIVLIDQRLKRLDEPGTRNRGRA